ncbi:MAG TPA: O-antigen ligase family protein [Candidatus Acidoferrales bacterium]|nr:O-antigen ligase family protein [Candidatus Acidoferrales bacterium]
MTAIRTGLLILLAFSVLAFGAVEVWSESVVEIGAATLLIAWIVIALTRPELKIDWNPVIWPLLALIGLGMAQLLFHTTVYTYFTRTELLRFAAYAILFFLATQLFRTRSELSEVAWFLIGFGFLVSLFGIIQHFTSNGRIYWFRELPLGGDLFGPYVNRNDFAGFVELTVPVGFSLMVFRGLRRELFPLATLLTIVPVSALVLSGSRGGIVSFVFEIGVLALLARSRRSKEGPKMAAVGIVTLAALAMIAWIGAGKAIERFSNLPQNDITMSRRFSMVRGAGGIVRDHPLLGSGLGTLVVAYPRHETAYDGKVVEHAHNDYVELLAEGGLAGGICGLAFLILLYRRARKSFEAEQGHFSRALHAGAIIALSGLLLHSFVDFNLHIPSNALLFLLQVQLATFPPLPHRTHQETRHRPSMRGVRVAV